MSVAVQLSASGSVVPAEKGQGEGSTETGQLPELRQSGGPNMALDVLGKPLPTSLQSDFLPEDVLLALTQPPPARDTLGPPSRFRHLDTSEMQARKRPANIWGFKRREKFDHLTQNPPCACGAGKDISFLYDVPQKTEPKPRPDKIDRSQVRREAAGEEKKKINLPDTLIPEEYHIIRNKGVLGIEYFEDKYSIQPEDHEKHLVTFPSLRPTKRSEVVQLKRTMHDMLDKAGVNDVEVEVKGPTQMHNLLELIKKEQNIYNVVFHEVIRQVSVECVERGELLAELRQRYSDLLNKIPHQIKSLHEEVMAQRALDRRLTEELMRFKTTISILTNELTDVKEHDRKVTKEAHQAQENLKAALAEAQKNASLLAEYHDLYELQRKRLERSVFMLSDEKEIWSTAAYSLALKVTEESRLTTAKRLHLSEKAWAKLANHFTILLSDRDTEVLAAMQARVEAWRDLTEDFHFLLRRREDEMREELAAVRAGIQATLDDFRKACFNEEGQMIRPPDAERAKNYLASIQQWNQHLNSISELFGGDVLLGGQESVRQIQQQVEAWTDSAIKVFARHRGLDGKQHPEQDRMLALNEDIERLLKQLQTRITGENGVAGGVIHLSNMLETWEGRLRASLLSQQAGATGAGGAGGGALLKEAEWGVLCLALEEWQAAVDSLSQCVGSVQPQDLRDAAPVPRVERMEVQECVKRTQKWVTTASNAVDSEDAKMMEMVSTLHAEMVQWMVQMLLRLAPDKEGNSAEAAELALLGSCSVAQLTQNARSLFERLTKFSLYIRVCCDSIVTENTQKRMENMEENADHELKELGRLQAECDQWVRTAKLLLLTLTGESMEELFPEPQAPLAPLTSDPVAPTPLSEPVFHDHEKLQSESDSLAEPAADTTSGGLEASASQEAQQEVTPTGDKATPTSDAATTKDTPPEVTEGGADATAEDADRKEEEEEKAADAEVEGVTGEERKDREGEAGAKAQEAGETFERLGDDDNTHRATMEVTASTPPPPEQGPPTAARTAGLDTQQAFQALAAVDSLQNQLLATEERAQHAEERAVELEAELIKQRENVRALERRLAQLEQAGGQRSTEGKSPTRVVSTPASLPSTASPAPTLGGAGTPAGEGGAGPRRTASKGSKKKAGKKD